MRPTTTIGPLVGRAVVALAITASPALAAAADIFLRLDGIPGESADNMHKGEIELLSYSHSFRTVTAGSTGSGTGAGRPTCGEVTASKQIDRSSPLLISHLLRGTVIPAGQITFRAGAGKAPEYYRVVLSDVTITAIEQTDQSDTQRIMEKVSLSARRFQFVYMQMTAKGTPDKPVTFGWDCAKNAPM